MDAGNGYNRRTFLKSIQVVPNVAKLPIVLGIEFFLQANYARLTDLYVEIIQTDHHFVDEHAKLADNAFQSGRVNEAMRQLKTWLANTDDRLSRGYATMFGRKLLVEVGKRYPSSAWVKNARATQWSVDADKALELFHEAIRQDSASVISYYLLAATYAEKEDWVNAARWLNETFHKSTGDEFLTVHAHLLAALVDSHLGNTKEALQDASVALQTDSAYATSSLFNGIYGRGYFNGWWFFLDKPIHSEFARSSSEKKVASLLNHAAGWMLYWRFLGRSYPKCTQFLDLAVDQNPDNVEAHFALARVRAYVGEYGKAIEIVERVLHRNRNNARAHRELGRLHWESQHREKAKQELERAIQLGDVTAKDYLDDLERLKK
jgi:tetratricopeptide (TPR) repeat protein